MRAEKVGESCADGGEMTGAFATKEEIRVGFDLTRPCIARCLYGERKRAKRSYTAQTYACIATTPSKTVAHRC
jgi:hypothetical protein